MKLEDRLITEKDHIEMKKENQRLAKEHSEISTLKEKPFVRQSSQVIGHRKWSNQMASKGLKENTPKW